MCCKQLTGRLYSEQAMKEHGWGSGASAERRAEAKLGKDEQGVSATERL